MAGRALALAGAAGLLGGCNMVVMSPSGDIAGQQASLVIQSTLLMLLIIVPVIALTLLFAWRYRASNKDAVYDPEWHHSTQLEVAIWSAPLMIIIALGAITWLSTHTLDPYRALMRLDSSRPVPGGTQPLVVEVVSLDWKWLFIYPEQGIASVNELAAPVDRPIHFRLTSANVMTTFYVPALAGMIYTMPGMQTQLHAVINKPGQYWGMAAHYNGSGFSRMNFTFHGVSQQGFDEWVAKVRSGGTPLNRAVYNQLANPSEQVPVTYYNNLEGGLFDAILNLCTNEGSMCMSEMHHIDMQGGAGLHSQQNRDRLSYDNLRNEAGHEAPGATVPGSGRPSRSEEQPEGMRPDALSPNVRPSPDAPGGTPAPTAPGGPSTPAPPQLNTPAAGDPGHRH